MEALKLRRWKEAEAQARAALEEEPGDLTSAVHLGEALLRQGRSTEALELSEAMLRQQDAPSLHGLRAAALIELGRREEALAAASATLKLAGDDAEGLLTISRVLGTIGYRRLAADAAHRALIARPGSAETLAQLATCLVASNPELAERRFRESLRLDPRQPQALLTLALLLQKRGQHDEAALALKSALALAPDFSAAREEFVQAIHPRHGKPVFFTVALFLLLASTYVIWDGRSSSRWWLHLVAGLLIGAVGVGLSRISARANLKRLDRLDSELGALARKVTSELDSGKGPAAPREAAPFFAGVAWGSAAFSGLSFALAGIALAAFEPMGLLVAVLLATGGIVLAMGARQAFRGAARARKNRDC